ncbi:AAA family ATPase [Ruegeria pomeroyi]|nr:AAA family ATPase [Ruegeria pomeroyi]
MRLSHIEIENFKGIGTKQSIDLAPITLLFGPNSAGKSTILQALHYLREILERNNPDPDQTIAGGLTDLGGFATLVHNHDLKRPIRIKVRIDMTEDQGSDRLPLNSGSRLGDRDFERLGIRYIVGENTELRDYAVVQEVGLGIEVRWSHLIDAPFISRLSAEMDGKTVAEIISPAQRGRARLCNFAFDHPLLSEITDPQADLELPEELSGEDGGSEFEVVSPLQQEVYDLSRLIASLEQSDKDAWERASRLRGALKDQLENRLAEVNQAKRPIADAVENLEGQDSIYAIAIDTPLGALPDLDKPLAPDLRDIEPADVEEASSALPRHLQVPGAGKTNQAIAIENARRAALAELLDELVLGPARIARDYLQSVTYIGPLREIPSRGYRPRLSPDESRWAQGLAAWDVLYTQAGDELLDSVNEWMSSDERLRTGYVLVKSDYKQISTADGLHQLFKRGINEDDLGDLQELYEAIPTKSEIGLMDVVRSIPVAPSDVGVGISQMVPVVVACLMEPGGLVAIEQPELHIHPAIQVGLGDLFITATQNEKPATGPERTLLVETHSEHIMLRLLRRVRELGDDELPPGVSGLKPSDISVVYVEGTERGPVFRRLRVSDSGDFVDNWPKGFFEERAEELF